MSNSRFHFPSAQGSTRKRREGLPRDSPSVAWHTKWHASVRSHARMLRFDWLIHGVGTPFAVASIRMCARAGAPRPRPVPSLCAVQRRSRIPSRNGIFSGRASPFSRPSEMADMAISRGAVIPRDSFAVTTVIAIRSGGRRVIEFSLDRSSRQARCPSPSLSLSLSLLRSRSFRALQ